MIHFYRRFLPRIAKTLCLLIDALLSGKSGMVAFERLADMDSAFVVAKQALRAAPCLAHSSTWARLNLVIDTSATHAGACLQQQLKGQQERQPLVFFSKNMETAQNNSSAFYRELFLPAIWVSALDICGRGENSSSTLI